MWPHEKEHGKSRWIATHHSPLIRYTPQCMIDWRDRSVHVYFCPHVLSRPFILSSWGVIQPLILSPTTDSLTYPWWFFRPFPTVDFRIDDYNSLYATTSSVCEKSMLELWKYISKLSWYSLLMTVRSTLATNFGSACFPQKISTGRAAHLKFSPSQTKKRLDSLCQTKKGSIKRKTKKKTGSISWNNVQ